MGHPAERSDSDATAWGVQRYSVSCAGTQRPRRGCFAVSQPRVRVSASSGLAARLGRVADIIRQRYPGSSTTADGRGTTAAARRQGYDGRLQGLELTRVKRTPPARS